MRCISLHLAVVSSSGASFKDSAFYRKGDFGDRFGSTPGTVYPTDSSEPWAPLSDVGLNCFDDTPREFSRVKELATVNYYKTTKDFQNFNNHDLIPENKNKYYMFTQLRDGIYDDGINQGVKITHQECNADSVDDGTWSMERIGPFFSEGGYDWWQVAWENLFSLKEKLKDYPGGVVIDKNVILPTRRDRSVLGYPPIHVHHIHIATAPGVRPRMVPYFCAASIKDHCFNGSYLFEWHGDFQCRPHEGSTACLYQHLPSGYGKYAHTPVDLEGELNDVRPSGSAPLEWYFEVGIHWYPAASTKATPLEPLSFVQVFTPGRVDLNNQQTYVATFPSPLGYDSFTWSHYMWWTDGYLLRWETHTHAQYFHKGLVVSGDPRAILDESFSPDADSALQQWKCMDVKDKGFSSSAEMYDHFLQLVQDNNAVTLQCSFEMDLEIIDDMRYDRYPPTFCRPWRFAKGDRFFVLGWNTKKTFRLTHDEPEDFDGTIISGTLPQHIAGFLFFVDENRGTSGYPGVMMASKYLPGDRRTVMTWASSVAVEENMYNPPPLLPIATSTFFRSPDMTVNMFYVTLMSIFAISMALLLSFLFSMFATVKLIKQKCA